MIYPGVWNTLVLWLSLSLRACAKDFNLDGEIGCSFDLSFLKLKIECKMCYGSSWLTCKGSG